MKFEHKLMTNNFDKTDFIGVKKLLNSSNPIF